MSTEPSAGSRAALMRAQRTALSVVLTIFVGSWLVVGALLAPVVGWPVVGAAVLLLTVIPLAIFIRSRGRGHYPGKAIRLFVFRPMWYAQLLLILCALGGLAGAIGGAPFGIAGTAGRAVIEGVAIIYFLLASLGYSGSRTIVTIPLAVTLPQLPPELEGIRVALICDTHIGPHTSRARLARVAAAVRASNPDLIAVAGDLIDDFAPDVDFYAAAFGDLAALLGVYIIAGNHEVYAGWEQVLPRLRALTHVVLVNESRIVEYRGARIAIAGTGDPAAGHHAGPTVPAPDIPATLAGIPQGLFTIVLAHNPALWPPLAAAGVPLTLSGHTHWGQFSMNRIGWSLANPFLGHAMGAYRSDSSLLYVSPGTNYWGIPFRIGARAEVTILTLRVGAEARVTGAQSVDRRTR